MTPTKQRLEWIDLFRGLAVIGMIETHSGNTFLDAALQTGPTWQSMTYYNGLIAPSFFWILGFVRGLAFHQATHRKPAWPAVKRLLVILGVGYAMHLPYALHSHGDLSEAAQWSMFMVDVLQCLAVSGMIIIACERMPKIADAAVALILTLLVTLSEHAQTWRTGLVPLDSYFTSVGGSLFPLFPWAGFALAGFLCSKARVTGGWFAVAAALLAFGIRHAPHLNWTVGFFLERLGWVMLIAFVTSTALERICRSARPATGWLYLAGRESLVVYVVHLMFIHALPWPGGSPEKQIGPTQTPMMVGAIFLMLLALSLAAAWLNERRKLWRRPAQ